LESVKKEARNGNKTLKRVQFAQKLVLEEKLWETVANIEKLNISRICRHLSKNLAIMLHVRETYGHYLNARMPIKKALREWVRQEIRTEFKALEGFRQRWLFSSFGQPKDGVLCDEDLKSESFNQQLRTAFKKSVREGASESILKANLVDAAIKFYIDETTKPKQKEEIKAKV
jgi:hypothetical protein